MRSPRLCRQLQAVLLCLCSAFLLASAQTPSCLHGVPASGVPTSWPQRSFTLVVASEYVSTTTSGGLPAKKAIAVNGSIPGPRLDVDSYDWVSVRVINQLHGAVTAIHWHGLSLYATPDADGVPGLTQCGIPPGGEMTYSFCATPSQTTWYHGHIDGQYVEGLSASQHTDTAASLAQKR